MKNHLLTTIAMVLSVFVWMAGFNAGNGGMMLSGEMILLSAIACRSAKIRRLEESANTNKRKVVELVLMSVAIALFVFIKDLKMRIAYDPIPYFVIPVISIMFYLIAFWRAKK